MPTVVMHALLSAASEKWAGGRHGGAPRMDGFLGQIHTGGARTLVAAGLRPVEPSQSSEVAVSTRNYDEWTIDRSRLEPRLNVLEIDDPPAVETAPPPLLERSHPAVGRGIGTLNRGRGDIWMTSSDQAAGLSFHPCSFNRSQYACAQFIASHSSWKSSVRTMSRSCRICTSTGMPCGYMMQRTSVARRRRHHSMRAPGWTVYVDTCVGAPFLAPTVNREFGRFKRNAACASRAAFF
jgi:hypothetical protein